MVTTNKIRITHTMNKTTTIGHNSDLATSGKQSRDDDDDVRLSTHTHTHRTLADYDGRRRLTSNWDSRTTQTAQQTKSTVSHPSRSHVSYWLGRTNKTR